MKTGNARSGLSSAAIADAVTGLDAERAGFAERIERMQPSQVNCYLAVRALWRGRGGGRGEVRVSSSGGTKKSTCCIAVGIRILRVKNAGCHEDFAVEPAEF